MPLKTLDQIPAENDPTHLLLIADTKLGKSTYAAQCAIDGFHLIYIDSDNGISALRHALKDHPGSMERVVLIPTNYPSTLIKDLFESSIFRWNRTKDKKFSSGMDSETDEIIEIIPSRIPSGVIVVDDSWTTTALDAMQAGAKGNKTDLESMSDDNKGQAVYGDAGIKLTLICAIQQRAKFNTMFLAHPTVYEIYEKPKGKIADIKQKDMILLDSIKIPLSSSRPHGYNMGKYFTDIGWIDVDRANRRILDFEIEYKRVGGGRPNKKGSINEMSFKTLFGAPPTTAQFDDSWIRTLTCGEWKAANKNAGASKPAGVNPDGAIASTPAKPNVSALMKKA